MAPGPEWAEIKINARQIVFMFCKAAPGGDASCARGWGVSRPDLRKSYPHKQAGIIHKEWAIRLVLAQFVG